MRHLITITLIFTSVILFAQSSTKKNNTDNQNSMSTVQRKVILENFTTAVCPNCPPIHVLLENYMASNPNAIIIAQHAGYYTDAMTIPENTQLLALYNDGGATYAPGLAIDRFHYPTGLTGGAADPGPVFWPGESHSATTARIDARLAIPSSISLNIVASVSGGTLNLDVSGSIEETVTGNDLRLVVYIIEDGLIYNQSGGGNNYVHNNVMRDAISATWGDSGVITSNTSGTTFSKNYVYSLDSNWAIDNLNVVAFVANYNAGNVNDREILQAEKLSLAAPVGVNNGALTDVIDVPDTCDLLISPIVRVKNYGSADITSLEIEYSINGGETTGSYNWSGAPITLFDFADITITDIAFDTLNETNPIAFEITQVNGESDDDTSNNTITTSFLEAPTSVDDYIHIFIETDENGDECTWQITNQNGDIVESGGPYGNNEFINYYASLVGDCYTFTVFDSGGDGGPNVIVADQSKVLFNNPGTSAYEEDSQEFTVPLNSSSVHDTAFVNTLIYPNPANTILNIDNAAGLNLSLSDVLGRVLIKKNAILEIEHINIESLKEGTYFLKLTDGDKVRTEKILIAK